MGLDRHLSELSKQVKNKENVIGKLKAVSRSSSVASSLSSSPSRLKPKGSASKPTNEVPDAVDHDEGLPDRLEERGKSHLCLIM